MARAIPNPHPGALEGELAREFAPLITQGQMVAPGAAGQAELQLFGRTVGAAATRTMMAGAPSAQNFLLAQSPPASDRPPRLLAAVCGGNNIAPVQVLGGTIALCELHRHVCGSSTRGGLEDDVRLALVEAAQRFVRIAAAAPPHTLAQWPFQNQATGRPALLSGLSTSLTALIVEGREVLLAHVGECQASRVSARGRSRQLLCVEHTLASDPALRQEHGPESPASPVMGDEPYFRLGSCPLSAIQIEWFPLEPGDTLLLWSAGPSQVPVDEDVLVRTLAEGEPATVRDQLMALASRHQRPDLSATVVILRPPY